ncbi:MAG TPA: hypothetical protein VEK33_25960 [Terriglobales bacterium]|nr:hypothetical protein [Terriglobales bacterium]
MTRSGHYCCYVTDVITEFNSEYSETSFVHYEHFAYLKTSDDNLD